MTQGTPKGCQQLCERSSSNYSLRQTSGEICEMSIIASIRKKTTRIPKLINILGKKIIYVYMYIYKNIFYLVLRYLTHGTCIFSSPKL